MIFTLSIFISYNVLITLKTFFNGTKVNSQIWKEITSGNLKYIYTGFIMPLFSNISAFFLRIKK